MPIVFGAAAQFLHFAGRRSSQCRSSRKRKRPGTRHRHAALFRSGTDPAPRRMRLELPSDCRDNGFAPTIHRASSVGSRQDLVVVQVQAPAQLPGRCDSPAADPAARPYPMRRANSSSPPGKRISPECPANRRTQPSARTASPLIAAPNRITSSGSAASCSRKLSSASNSPPTGSAGRRCVVVFAHRVPESRRKRAPCDAASWRAAGKRSAAAPARDRYR